MPLKRNRTPSKYIYYYALQLYFSGLSLRKTSQQRLSQFIKRNHISIWNNWIQWYRPKKILQKKMKVSSEFIIDETLLKVGENYVWWLWVAIEPIDKI
ncbi:MAG TPA: hypothetical protein VFJ05_01550 [Nitrososphaeraceae archaeon]|nr:hypothetical protein [Nitrososphaeraceae archaeon]